MGLKATLTIIHCDRTLYRWRHLSEKHFVKIKKFRATATHYDKTGGFGVGISLAGAIIASQ